MAGGSRSLEPSGQNPALRDDVTKRNKVPSLFVVSLPRSLSTLIYHAVRQSVGLEEPIWTSDGEIMNLDRFRADAGAGEGFRPEISSQGH